MRKGNRLFLIAMLCSFLVAGALQAQPADSERSADQTDKPALDVQKTEEGKAVDTDKPALELHKKGGTKTDDSVSTPAASAPYDLQFVDTMSAHHKDGIKMAQMGLNKTQNADLKQMLSKLVQGEQEEVQKLKSLRKQVHAGGPKAVNMDLPGMTDAKEDLKDLKDLKGTEFDEEFLDKMIKHHEGAVEMAKDADDKAENSQIKQMAQMMVEKKQKEIEQMKTLKDNLNK